jgi:hypothetical protein
VDALSKFPIGIPLANKEMISVAEGLWKTITVFGAPKALLSDNGAEFVNDVVGTLTSLHGIDRRVVTAYRPQANGQVERFNRSLLAILRKCTGDSPRRWVEWLDFALMAIRTTVHASTGFTPHELMFGRPHHPMSKIMGAGVLVWERADSDGEAAATWLGRLAAHMRRCQEVWREGREQGAKAQEGQRKVQDGRGRVVEQRLVSGTRVLLREEHREHKLAHRFVGPFSVEGDASGGNYWIVDDVLQNSVQKLTL